MAGDRAAPDAPALGATAAPRRSKRGSQQPTRNLAKNASFCLQSRPGRGYNRGRNCEGYCIPLLDFRGKTHHPPLGIVSWGLSVMRPSRRLPTVSFAGALICRACGLGPSVLLKPIWDATGLHEAAVSPRNCRKGAMLPPCLAVPQTPRNSIPVSILTWPETRHRVSRPSAASASSRRKG